jgi:hypothetical protein
MTRRSITLAAVAASAAILTVISLAPRALRAQDGGPLPTHQVPTENGGGVVVMLCDGKTSMTVKGLKPGESMTHEKALAVTRELMADWQRQHPNEKWQLAAQDQPAAAQTEQTSAPATAPAAQQSSESMKAAVHAMQQGDTYASFTDRDYKVWKAQTDSFVAQGKKIFHDAKELGGTIGVSCDMCHPDGSNTHPETYPKYQVQLQRVALLRDMIDWCIENPVKGKALDPNDPKLRALEAYILAQRKGVPLDYGKH